MSRLLMRGARAPRWLADSMENTGKILVTGAAGFLGPRVVLRLCAHGHRQIRCLVRDRNKLPRLQNVADQYPEARLEFCFGNLKSASDLTRALDGVDLVFHLAAAMKGTPADMFLDSVVASRNLLDAISDRKPMRVVLVSTFGVYGVSGLGRGALVNEQTPLEAHPERRDPYSHSKLAQEQLFWDYQRKHGFELVVVRPGVIYGPGGGQFSVRVGLNLFGVFLHLGGANQLPLTYVDNCAEAIVVAGSHPDATGQVYNVHDDGVVTSRQYLRAYKKNVRRIRSIRVPYPAMMLLSQAVEAYHRYSHGQMPAVFTPYKTAANWGGNRFDNSKLKSIGWKQLIGTEDALARTFQEFRAPAPPAGA